MKKTKMLKKNYEFRNVLKNGKYFSGEVIEAFILKNKQEGNNSLGLAISTKLGKAFQRNKIKRLLRENYRMLEDKVSTGYSIVFLLKKNKGIDNKNINFYTIKKDMNRIFNKSKVIESI